MSKITGWGQIETGGTDPAYRPKGSSYSVARLIEIVLELKQLVSTLDPSAIAAFQTLADTLTAHVANTNTHLTTSLRNSIVALIEAWEGGTLGGGSGGATVYTDVADLLATPGVTGSVGVLQSEPSNLYIWNPIANRWTVRDGNIYATADDLPDDTQFYIPLGTVLIVSSTGERYIQADPDLEPIV